MRHDGAGRRKRAAGFACAVAAVVLMLCLAPAAAETPAAGDDTVVLILAQDAASRMNLTNPDGTPLKVRTGQALPGRGQADAEGKAPDYTGVVGYAALGRDPEIDDFSVLNRAYWMIPLFRTGRTKEGELRLDGSISHKTPVLVTAQELEADGNGGYRGMLTVIRLDTEHQSLMDVSCFATVPYWTLPVKHVGAYGYGIAVYRETPGPGPRDADGKGVFINDGTRVLIPFTAGEATVSPDPDRLVVRGVIFRNSGDGTVVPRTVWFREEDLVLSY